MAHAQATPLGQAKPRAQPPTKTDDQQQALRLFEQGKQAYREGRFEDSVKLLEQAFALVPEPVLLYNLARAHEGTGNFPSAIEAYERYLKSEQEIPDRGAIEQKLTSLKRTVAERERLAKERDEALQKKEAAPEPRLEPPPSQLTPWPWLVASVGAGGLVSGGVLGSLALSKNDEAEVAPSQQQAFDLRSSAESFATASTALFVIGGVVLAGGVTWGIIELVSQDDAAPGDNKAELMLGPSSVWLKTTF
jgi:tetratricopeptide (TPR) repeat protein